MLRKIFLLLLLTFFCSYLSAQPELKDSVSVIGKNVEYLSIGLPPLAIFLDAANSYSQVKYFDAMREEEVTQMKITRKDWLKYFRLQANYQYGTNDAYMTETGGQLPLNSVRSSMVTQSWYNAGAVLSVPLDDLFGRKKKVDLHRARLAQIDYEADRALEDRQLLILQSYNEVVKHLAILRVKAEAVALYDAQMKISENDFINGKIDIISLSLERSRRSAAIVTYEESRASLHNSVTLLEMLTGVKIIRK